jgi:hypothetical protein
MTSLLRVESDRSVRPSEGSRARWPLLVSAGLGLLGILEVVAVYLDLQARLPASVPDHFGVSGQVNGALPPTTLVAVELGTISAVAIVFFVILRWGARSPPLAAQFQQSLVLPLLIMEGTIVVAAVPTISGLLFASAAGVWGVSGQGLGLVALAVGLLPLIILAVVLLRSGRSRIPTVPKSTLGDAPTPALLGVGGPVELACSSCGETFRLSGVPLLSPHMGFAGKGSLYVRCPRCGERGWDSIMGKVAR